MNIKNEHILVIILILVIVWLYFRRSEMFDPNEGKINVINDRWAFPLPNEASDSWTREFDRTAYYSRPDGHISMIPVTPSAIPRNYYKDQIYNGDFEIPDFNGQNLPKPKGDTNGNNDVNETEKPFMYGPSCDEMPKSQAQQHYYNLRRQMQLFERPIEEPSINMNK